MPSYLAGELSAASKVRQPSEAAPHPSKPVAACKLSLRQDESGAACSACRWLS